METLCSSLSSRPGKPSSSAKHDGDNDDNDNDNDNDNDDNDDNKGDYNDNATCFS